MVHRRAAYREKPASIFNPTVFVIPKEPTVKSAVGGAVDLLVVLDREGAVTSACVLESAPEGVFEQATAEAVRQWRYAVADVATLSARQMKIRVNFAMK
jgi:TonB family protein